MNRRELLVATCASMAGLAGCSSDATGPGTSTITPTPLSKYDCPPHDSYSGAAVCSHTVETGSASAYLLPSQTTVDASTGTVELTLHNKSSTELEFNPYQWSILKRSSAGWNPIETRSSGNGQLTLSPGETHTWTFGEVVDFIDEEATVDTGTYIAGIDIPNPDGSDWIRCIALFRLV
ncbi:hypothetical protein [Halosimplex pelagicum]|uniref:Intracellular proteinase inhibitor BsuPI domain-containing protein n=1 Tax=Halosimplex pelagicum TaxID=869886 RepID=A0A7D5P4N8_9EURY|nr:hypothetical protein [Halosimplex pelagicum]QLH80737.1 hypothetical protein HZS54_03405 [Halosimplex pelagicum]